MAEKEYIEREVLIKACEKIIQDRWNETTAPVSWSHAYADFVDDIKEQPAADVAPVRHGEWEYKPPTATLNGAWKCTACKCYFWEHTANEFKYCPNCGAKMDG